MSPSEIAAAALSRLGSTAANLSGIGYVFPCPFLLSLPGPGRCQAADGVARAAAGQRPAKRRPDGRLRPCAGGERCRPRPDLAVGEVLAAGPGAGRRDGGHGWPGRGGTRGGAGGGSAGGSPKEAEISASNSSRARLHARLHDRDPQTG